MIKRHPEIVAFLFCLGLSACAAPKGEDWPSVSFGPEVEATNAAIEKAPEVTLAPLPSLLAEEKEGLDNPSSYLQQVAADYREVVQNLEARHKDYNAAREELHGPMGEAFRDNWLTAQMELSNISQYTEELPKLRARIAALGDAAPEEGHVILAQIEGGELKNRVYIKEQKKFLASIEPQ